MFVSCLTKIPSRSRATARIFGEDKGVCKHIWATLIAAEAENHLEDATFKKVQHPVAVVPAAEAEELLDDDGTNYLGFDDDDDLNEGRFWDGVFDDDAPTDGRAIPRIFRIIDAN